MSPPSTELSGWGRFPRVRGLERRSEDLVAACRGAVLSRGAGRSYGDASLPPAGDHVVCGTRRADRLLHFDAETGVLRAEAGVTLADLDAVLWPRGWTVPVVPGTRHVTLGGMVAADVHGKNHHVAGCLGAHVRALKMVVADGRCLDVSDDHEPELLAATLGGMGLTGHVIEVELQLESIPSPWIHAEVRRVADVDEAIGALREASARWPFTVAWIDSTARDGELGRGILTCGRWAEAGEAPADGPPPPRSRRLPCALGARLVAPWSIRLFNAAYFRRGPPAPSTTLTSPHDFFHPLDGVRDWNRAYGRRGFTQYQCVVPRVEDAAPVRRLLDVVRRHGAASPVTVLKDCGEQGRGLLSFPMRGMSLALDLPLRGAATQSLVDELNENVIALGGRVYLAKDVLTRPEHFAAMEPRLPAFDDVRRRWDPERRLRSALSVRLFGDGP